MPMKTSLARTLSLPLTAFVMACTPALAQEEAREQAQDFFEDDKATEATATLAAAAAKNPTDRVLAAMLYASVRDHVWHPLQVAPVALAGAITALNFTPDGKWLAGGSSTGEVAVLSVEAK